MLVTSTTLPSPRTVPPSPSTLIQPQLKQTPSPKSPEHLTVLSATVSPSVSPATTPLVDGPRSVLDDIDRQNEKVIIISFLKKAFSQDFGIKDLF